MSVTEVAGAIGDWSVKLKADTPQYILDQLEYFGHIAITSARVDPEAAGDSLLTAARYVGVLRDRSFGHTNKALGGAGMALWLGDEDDKGEIIETPLVFTNSTFTAALNTALPAAVTAGTITPLAGTYSGSHVFQSARKVIDFICSIFDAEWRVNGDGTLDAGEIADLYVTEPKTAILRNRSGVELTYKALDGIASLDSDVKDFTTRVLLIAEGTEAATVSAAVDINPVLNPYKDIHGNPVERTRIISEQQTDAGNAQARAQLQLNRFTSPRDALKLTTKNYDIKGDVAAGDYVWVYDPDARLINESNPIDFHGQEIYPMKLRVFQLSWPIVAGMGVQYRDPNGVWIDLSDYVEWESGDTQVTVGGYNRSLTGVGSGLTEDPGSRPITNSTIPKPPVWNEADFVQSTYQSDDDGLTRAQLELHWDQPLNTDNSVISDGAQYEIRRRTGQNALYPPTHAEMAALKHNQLIGQYDSPIPFDVSAWEYFPVPWDATSYLMLDLTPGIPYEFQIRAYDVGVPPNVSNWSDVAIVQTRPDTTSPSIPAAPSTIAGSRNAIQVVHTLGRSSGGTFNLEADLNHLEVHVGYDAAFVPDPLALEAGGTMLGKLPANTGMMRGQIPAVGTFPLNENPDVERWIKVVAVDHFGNRSSGSDGAQQTAELIDSAFISELTVSKVTAGTIAASWIMAGEIVTAITGPRMRMGWFGLEAYNANGQRTFYLDATTGNTTMIGTLQSGVNGRRVVIEGGTNDIKFFPEVGETRSARLYSYIPLNFPDDVAIEMRSIDSDTSTVVARHWMLPDQQAMMVGSKTDDLIANTWVHVKPSDIEIAVFNGLDASQTRDGGFIWLRKGDAFGGDTYFGKKTGTIDAWLRFGAADIDMAWNNTVITSWNANGIHATAFRGLSSGAGYRAPIAAQDGGDVFFYWTGGGAQLNIGTGSSFIKTFVIDHPDKPQDSWLVHGTIEAPVAGVEYNGVAIVEDGEVEVELPSYFEGLTHTDGRSVQLTVVAEDSPADRGKLKRRKPRKEHKSESEIPPPPVPMGLPAQVQATYPRNGKFTIYAVSPVDTFRVFWTVKAVRKDVPQFEVEPSKAGTERMGDGPYTYLVEK